MIDKTKLLETLKMLERRSIESYKDSMFWNCPNTLSEYRGKSSAYCHMITLIERGTFDKDE